MGTDEQGGGVSEGKQIQELAMLVRILCKLLPKCSKKRKQAIEYLERNGLMGSIFEMTDAEQGGGVTLRQQSEREIRWVEEKIDEGVLGNTQAYIEELERQGENKKREWFRHVVRELRNACGDWDGELLCEFLLEGKSTYEDDFEEWAAKKPAP